MDTKPISPWMLVLRSGLTGGAIAILLSLVGMVEAFSERFIVSGWFTMGQVLFLAPMLLVSYSVARRAAPKPVWQPLLAGSLAGLIGGALLAVLVLIGRAVNLRDMFANASPQLYEILTLGQDIPLGLFLLLLVTAAIGLISAGVFILPERLRRTIIIALVWVLMVGLLRDLIMTVVNQWVDKAKSFPDWAAWARPIIGFISTLFSRQIFAASGLRQFSAVVLFLLVGGLTYWRARQAKQIQNPQLRIRETAPDGCSSSVGWA
jgi:hypothetical protein